MSRPFFSVVIPTLNEEECLPLLLDDLVHQTFIDMNIWIADGNSTDNTRLIVQTLKKQHPSLHLLTCNKQNVGTQRNFGAKKSDATHILFLDADNRIPLDFLEKLHASFIKKHTDACTTYSKPDTDNIQDKIFIRSVDILMELAWKINYPMLPIGSCIACTRKVFESVGGFDESFTYAEDTDFVRKIAKKHFSFLVLRKPEFTVSLRRFRKEGTLNIYRKLVPLMLKFLIDGKVTDSEKQYPMRGGSYYGEKDKPSLVVLDNLNDLIKQLTTYSKQKIKELVENIQ